MGFSFNATKQFRESVSQHTSFGHEVWSSTALVVFASFASTVVRAAGYELRVGSRQLSLRCFYTGCTFFEIFFGLCNCIFYTKRVYLQCEFGESAKK